MLSGRRRWFLRASTLAAFSGFAGCNSGSTDSTTPTVAGFERSEAKSDYPGLSVHVSSYGGRGLSKEMRSATVTVEGTFFYNPSSESAPVEIRVTEFEIRFLTEHGDRIDTFTTSGEWRLADREDERRADWELEWTASLTDVHTLQVYVPRRGVTAL